VVEIQDVPIRNRFGRFLPDLNGTRVLIVDDYPDTLYSLKRVLEYCGASVTAAASADEAVKAFDEHAPHVLVADLNLPGRDGFWLIDEVRRRSPQHGGSCPAIAMTAYPERYLRGIAVSIGFQAFISKPAEPEQLCSTIATLVRELR
jgi:CheY-like chemotaxis protein